MVDVKALDVVASNKIVLICTGSQGEPMAALSRMANRDHKIEVGEGDTVLLASSLIPGNENAVFRVINGIARLGADVVHKGNALVHVPTTAAGDYYCYNVIQPRNAMPVHGEWRHLRANGDIAIKTGVPAERVITQLVLRQDVVSRQFNRQDRQGGFRCLRLRRATPHWSTISRVINSRPKRIRSPGLHLGVVMRRGPDQSSRSWATRILRAGVRWAAP